MSLDLIRLGATSWRRPAGGGGGGGTSFQDAIVALSPIFYLPLQDTSGTVPANLGTGSGTLTIEGPMLLAQEVTCVPSDPGRKSMSNASSPTTALVRGNPAAVGSAGTERCFSVCVRSTDPNTSTNRIFFDADNVQWMIAAYGSGTSVAVRTSGATRTTSVQSTEVVDGVSHMYILQVREITGVLTMEFYIDGVLRHSENEPASAAGRWMLMRRESTSTQNLVGNYSDFFAMDRALTPAEIASLTAAGGF